MEDIVKIIVLNKTNISINELNKFSLLNKRLRNLFIYYNIQRFLRKYSFFNNFYEKLENKNEFFNEFRNCKLPYNFFDLIESNFDLKMIRNRKIFFISLNDLIYKNNFKIYENSLKEFEINYALSFEIIPSLLNEDLKIVLQRNCNTKLNVEDFTKINKKLTKRGYIRISQEMLNQFMNEYFCLNQIRKIYNLEGHRYFECLKDSLVGNGNLRSYGNFINYKIDENIIMFKQDLKSILKNKRNNFSNYTKFFIKETCKLTNEEETIENFMKAFNFKRYINKNKININF